VHTGGFPELGHRLEIRSRGTVLATAVAPRCFDEKMQHGREETDHRLSPALPAAGDGIIATDARGRIQFMNSVAERLTGWTAEEALGEDSRRICNLDTTDHKAAPSPVMAVLRAGQRVDLTHGSLLVKRDGSRRPVTGSAAPLVGQQGRISGMILVIRDFQEQQAQAALRERIDELGERNRDLDAFGQAVAHDLRNPLSLVLGYAELLQNNLASYTAEESASCLAIIARNGERMARIIDELLLFAQLRQLDVPTGPVDMAAVVAEACSRLAIEIQEQQATVLVPAEWPTALGYEPWLEEVWVNYLSNALKYGGRPPHIVLGAEIVQSAGPASPAKTSPQPVAAQPMARFWIRDDGPGIRPGDQAQLFAPFARLQPSCASGYGLGLSIVRRIVQKLGGRVGVESRGIPGDGCVFSFSLPAAFETH
jgi:PAS domain S-box-containing protein